MSANERAIVTAGFAILNHSGLIGSLIRIKSGYALQRRGLVSSDPRSFGLAIPQSLITTAGEVIE